MSKNIDRPQWNDAGTFRDTAKITLNGVVTQSPYFYAPTTSGENYKVLLWRNGKPSWEDIGVQPVISSSSESSTYSYTPAKKAFNVKSSDTTATTVKLWVGTYSSTPGSNKNITYYTFESSKYRDMSKWETDYSSRIILNLNNAHFDPEFMIPGIINGLSYYSATYSNWKIITCDTDSSTPPTITSSSALIKVKFEASLVLTFPSTAVMQSWAQSMTTLLQTGDSSLAMNVWGDISAKYVSSFTV